MKNIHILKGVFIAFIALQFFACNNEPLEGDFPPRNEEQMDTLQVSFEATIAGEKFIATDIDAKITTDNYLLLSGENKAGEKISFTIRNISEGSFDLFGGENSHNRDTGLYLAAENEMPYTTDGNIDGGGRLSVNVIDANFNRISGNFHMEVARLELDINGEPLLDENGDPIIEKILIEDGIFTNIKYQITSEPGGGSGGGSAHDFFARVNNQDFEATSVRVNDTLIADTHMLQIVAKNSDKDMIRIDLPFDLQLGTYDMVSISNGTALTGIYKANEGEVLTASPGTLTIEEFDRENGLLMASFEFRGKDPLGNDPTEVNVRQGKMKIRFEGIPGGNNTFSALIDGRQYNASSIEISSESFGEYQRYVIATEVENRQIKLSFPITVREGSPYTMSGEITRGTEVHGQYSPDEGETLYTSEHGEFTLVEWNRIDGEIEGVFEFHAVDMTGDNPEEYSITEGQFFISLP